ncbi:MAG: murein L,D-transpeptidase, partial [Acidobacteria bacterium]|nr:murein L,D-transpeptidase [Acidobacteriota bacterium]
VIGVAQEPASRPRRVIIKTVSSKKAVSPKPRPLTRFELTEAEFQLAALGYWLKRADGLWDESSRHALTAFQKVENLPLTGKLTRDVYEHLLFARRPEPREDGPAHIEVDLRRQVLFIVNDEARVTHVLPVSTGSGEEFTSEGWTRDAITPPGRFNVQRKIAGWHKSPLGMMYFPNYLFLGLAIHGSESIPTKPASHGCVRVPMFAAAELAKLMPKDTPVVVYDGLTPFVSFRLITPMRWRALDVRASN